MVEQENSQEVLARERALINPVVTWLYDDDEQACPPRNQLARERAEQLGLEDEELRPLLTQASIDDRKWLAFYLAGLDDDAFATVDPEGERHTVLEPLYERATEEVLTLKDDVQVTPAEVVEEDLHEELPLPSEMPDTKTARAAMKRVVKRAPRRESKPKELAVEAEPEESDEEAGANPEHDEDQVVTADITRQYMREIGKVPLLTAEEEVEIGVRIEAGLAAREVLSGVMPRPDNLTTDEELEWLVLDGQNAQEHMANANLRLVVSIAKKYTGRDMPFLDLIQEGNMGLMHAIEKFDYTKGFKFSTYATWWIRQNITRAIADKARVVRLPVHLVEKHNKILNARARLFSKNSVEPTHQQLAEEVGMSAEEVQSILAYGRGVLSLEMPIGDESGDMTLGDLLSDGTSDIGFDAFQHGRTREVILEVLETLSDRERSVIVGRMGLYDGQPKTLDEIGREFGVTRERIRQIESKTMSKLRHPSRSAKLRRLIGE